MKNLVKLQLRNLFHNKLYYIIFGISLLILGISIYFSFEIENINIKAMPEVIGIISTGIDLIDIILIALFCCYDFNEGTTKNIVSRGYSKRELLFSKYIVSIIGVFVMYLSLSFLAFIVFAKNGIGFETNMLSITAISIIGIVTSIIFYSSISFLLEKNSSALLVCILGPTLFSQVLGIIDGKLNINLTKYWFDNLTSNFIANKTPSSFIITTLLYLLYITLFIIISTKLVDKKEIK